MKILKKILLVLGVLVAIILIVGLCLPSKVSVERSIEIKGPAKLVFEQINTLKNWENWSPWYNMDPKMELTYSGPPSGKGAKYTWKSEMAKVGSGTLTITETIPDSMVNTEMVFNDGKGSASFVLNKIPVGTKVTWSMQSDMGQNPIARYIGLMMDKMMGADFEKGLQSMKYVIETVSSSNKTVDGDSTIKKDSSAKSNPSANTQPTTNTNYKVEETTAKFNHTLIININSSVPQMDEKRIEAFHQILAYMKKNGYKQAGPPFAINHSFSSDDSAVFDAGIPVTGPAVGEGKITPFEMKGGRVIKLRYTGQYSQMQAVYNALGQYMGAHHQTMIGVPWQNYIVDPMTEKDSKKWVTEAYFMLGNDLAK